MLLGAHAKEAAKGHNRIRHTTTDFLNHQALYVPMLFPAVTVRSSSI
jgi:hypothetical protein